MSVSLESCPQSLNGDELTKILATYLAKVDDTEIVDQDEPGGLQADEVLCQLLKPELEEINALGDKIDISFVALWVANLTVRASAVAMNKSPQEAIPQIATLVSEAREHLRNGIEDARQQMGETVPCKLPANVIALHANTEKEASEED
jgi:hypothetical protein